MQALLELLHVDFAAINWLPCIAGMITSGVCGYLAISFMVKLIGRCNFKWFSLYLLILSILTFTNSFLSPFLYLDKAGYFRARLAENIP